MTEEKLVLLDLEDPTVRHLLPLALQVRKVNGENSPQYLALKARLVSLSKENVETPDPQDRQASEDREDPREWRVLKERIQQFPDLSVYEVCPVCLVLLP